MKTTKRREPLDVVKFPFAVLLVLAAFSLLAYQNCGANMSFTAEKPSVEQFLSTSVVTINNGASYTTDANVKIQFKVSGSIEDMYVTNDATCEVGGDWQPIATERPWVLNQLNMKAEVFVRFRPRGGAALPCINASIIHDNLAPSVSIVKGPGTYSKNLVEDVEFAGADSGSGLDKFECRFTGQSQYKDCAAIEKLSILTAGSTLVNLQVRAVDKAGNRSALLERNWLIDRTPPTLTILEKPDSVSAKNHATFRMEANDEVNGSGVESVYCQLDSGPTKMNCDLTEVAQSLTEGGHLFQAWAIDKAGNESPKSQVMWTVTTPPPGSFQILGVTSSPGTGNELSMDTEINGILGTSLVPRIHWSDASGAGSYAVSILNQAGTATVCPAIMTPTATYAFSTSQCTLVDGGRYIARVIPYTAQNNLPGTPQTLAFYVDATGPMIIVQPAIVTADQKTATLTFSISDSGSGVRDAICKKTYKSTEQTFSCKDLTTYRFDNLADGEHIFTITATDVAQNIRTSTPISWISKLIVCDPFAANGDGTCKKGLKGNIYYLTGDQLTRPFNSVDEYIEKGKLANAMLYLSKVFVPTRSFSSGFVGDESVAITDDSGEKLIEYFALDLETIVKLNATDKPGRYQFAVLSDDGAILQAKDASGRWNDVVNNDGTHSTKMGCDMTGLVLDQSSRIPMRLKYYQGPRTEIALTLMWRHRANNESLGESICGSEGNEEFFGPNYNDMSNTAKFGKLIDRKWSVLTSDNFILEEAK